MSASGSDLHLTGVDFIGVASAQEIGKYYDRLISSVNASWLDNMPLSVIDLRSGGSRRHHFARVNAYLVEHGTRITVPVGDEKALAEM